MANEYEGDAFISYAHLDNVELDEGRGGWVTNLQRALEARVAQLYGAESRIWWDPKLQGNDYFSDTLEQRLQRVKALIQEYAGMCALWPDLLRVDQENLVKSARERFKAFRDASRPVFEKLYASVETGEETRRVLDANSRPDYRQQLEKELKEIADSEMWQAGAQVRALRPERQGR